MDDLLVTSEGHGIDLEANVKALSPIAFEPDEQALMEVLEEIARQLPKHRVLRDTANGEAPLAVKGGTGMVMGLGLTRPSTDLDIDVSMRSLTPTSLSVAVREIAGSLPGFTVERCDVKQHGRGYIRLWMQKEGWDGRIQSKIDMQDATVGRHIREGWQDLTESTQKAWIGCGVRPSTGAMFSLPRSSTRL